MRNADMPAMPQDSVWKKDMEAHLARPARLGAPSMDGVGLTKLEEISSRLLAAAIAAGRRSDIEEINGAIYAANRLLNEIERRGS